MTDRILCVDDDPNVLDAFKRALRREFQIDTACSGEQALAMVASQGPYAVIVSDMRMPGMDGIRLLAAVKQQAPRTVRIMLTGHSDQETAIEAVNEGSIFRFLCKPCAAQTLGRVLAAAVEQYRLVTAEQELLEKTLHGSIKVLTDVLALVNPAAFGRASRVRRTVHQLAAQLKVGDYWHLEIAAMLSQIGLVAVPADTVDNLYQGKALTAEEQQMVATHPAVGRDLVANIPRLEAVAQIIAGQEQRYDRSARPGDSANRGDVRLGASMLKVALDFDALLCRGLSDAEALRRLQARSGWYDAAILAGLKAVVEGRSEFQIRPLRVFELTDQMIFAEDVTTITGVLVVAKGQEITRSLRQRLANYMRNAQIRQPIRVLVPRAAGKVSKVRTPEHALGAWRQPHETSCALD